MEEITRNSNGLHYVLLYIYDLMTRAANNNGTRFQKLLIMFSQPSKPTKEQRDWLSDPPGDNRKWRREYYRTLWDHVVVNCEAAALQ